MFISPAGWWASVPNQQRRAGLESDLNSLQAGSTKHDLIGYMEWVKSHTVRQTDSKHIGLQGLVYHNRSILKVREGFEQTKQG